jgi:hypothetical protein
LRKTAWFLTASFILVLAPASPKIGGVFMTASLPKSGPLYSVIVAIVLVAITGAGALRAQFYALPRVPNPASRTPILQPLPFSHKMHTQFLHECKDCHQISADGWTMHYPPEEKCMICHATIMTDSPAIKKLSEYAAQKKPVPWAQVYAVPDYVYFSHRTHINKAKLDCEACHGAVRERDVLTKEKPTSMAACINCHKGKGAETGCRTCHDTI